MSTQWICVHLQHTSRTKRQDSVYPIFLSLTKNSQVDWSANQLHIKCLSHIRKCWMYSIYGKGCGLRNHQASCQQTTDKQPGDHGAPLHDTGLGSNPGSLFCFCFQSRDIKPETESLGLRPTLCDPPTCVAMHVLACCYASLTVTNVDKKEKALYMTKV